jgi:proteasome lid subunit RPN8/RPN11
MNIEKPPPEFIRPKTTYGDTLRFTAYAYAKLLWMRDRGNTEVAGYGVTATEDPLLITDFVLVKQECTGASFDFDPEDGADYMDRMLDTGLPPWAYSNILIHTHPGNSPNPSGVDETNFQKAFSHPNWAIMFIIAEGGATYCRLKINVGPGVCRELKVCVDWKHPFSGSNCQEWENEYKLKVGRIKMPFRMTGKDSVGANSALPSSRYEDQFWLDKEVAAITNGCNYPFPEDDEFANIDCHWNEDGCIEYFDDQTYNWYLYDPSSKKWYILDDFGKKPVEIDMGNHKEAALVVQWANQSADEQSFIMEE